MSTFIWQRRGPFAVVLTALTILAVAIISWRSSGPALATSDGNPYVVPEATDTNPDPDIFETTITAEAHTVDIGNGVQANVLTFNGTIPGPTIRLHVGETVIVHFKNNIAHDTGIHWHGIELDNESDGTPLTQNQVSPGGTYLYKFKVTRPGLFWYHPHHHSSTNQVFKGLYGMIIVTDANDDTLTASGVLPPAAQTKVFALSDTSVCGAQGTNVGNLLAICETTPIDEDGNPRGPGTRPATCPISSWPDFPEPSTKEKSCWSTAGTSAPEPAPRPRQARSIPVPRPSTWPQDRRCVCRLAAKPPCDSSAFV